MAISFSKYVKITSGVGGGAGVRQRDLIPRILTQSEFVSPDGILEFTDAASVGSFFGIASNEYKRAVLHFGYVSPVMGNAKKLSFGRYSPTGNVTALYGKPGVSQVSVLKTIVAGVLNLTYNGVATNLTGINFGAAVTLADVATALQTVIRAAAGVYTLATVAYNVQRASFLITLDVANLGVLMAVQSGAGVTDAGSLLGLYVADGALDVKGVAAMAPVAAFNNTLAINNNFGSFLFNSAITSAEQAAVSAACAAINVEYLYSTTTLSTGAAAVSAALIGFAGTGVTLSGVADGSDLYDMIPCTIMAATDYSKKNGAVGYMYKQFPLPPLVTDDANSTTYDSLRVNYYGMTAKAGQNISFYQLGTLMGGTTAPTDMNTYANEMWLKDYAASQIMALQLSQGRIPANATGIGNIYNILQPVIADAVKNGVISVGKTLTPVQRVFVSTVTGDDLAFHAVENIGYVLNITIQSYVTTDGRTQYKAVYSLIYSKDDTIRFVEGTHSLI